jgi:hypothetical protein
MWAPARRILHLNFREWVNDEIRPPSIPARTYLSADLRDQVDDLRIVQSITFRRSEIAATK